LDDHANPVFLISTMAMHTQNVQADPRSSLLVTQADATGDPLGASRVTLLGNILLVPAAEAAEVRELYLAIFSPSNPICFPDASHRVNSIAASGPPGL
jgi:heme iron utilization protein